MYLTLRKLVLPLYDIVMKYTLVSLCLVLLLSGCSLSRKNQVSLIPAGQGSGVLQEVSTDQQHYLLDAAYGTISSADDPLAGYKNTVIVVVRENGTRVGVGHSQTSWLRRAVEQATKQAMGGNDLPKKGQQDVHIHLLLDERTVFDPAVYDHGNYAVRMEKESTQRLFRGSYGIETNRSTEKMLTELCKELWVTEQCYQLPDMVEIVMAPELHFGTTPQSDGDIVTFYRGKEFDTDLAFDEQEIREVLARANDWMEWSVMPTGQLYYQYYPSNGKYSSKNNMIRQLMWSRILALRSHDDPTVRKLHERNLAHILATWYEEDGDHAYIFYKNKSKLGATAMMLRVLVASPFFDEYTAEAEKLATTIAALQEEDGWFLPRRIEPDYTYDKDYLLTFYSGEALVALVEYYQRVWDMRRLEIALKSGEFYLQRYVAEIDQWYYPAYVPWHSIAWNHLYKITKDPRRAEGVFVLNDKLIEEMQRTPTNARSPDRIGRFYNPAFSQYGSPHSSSDGVYMDGLAFAYELAVLMEDAPRMARYAESLALVAHNLGNLQYRDSDMYFMSHPERAEGAIRVHLRDNSIRIDTTQHMIDGFVKVVELIENGSLPWKRSME